MTSTSSWRGTPAPASTPLQQRNRDSESESDLSPDSDSRTAGHPEPGPESGRAAARATVTDSTTWERVSEDAGAEEGEAEWQKAREAVLAGNLIVKSHISSVKVLTGIVDSRSSQQPACTLVPSSPHPSTPSAS